MIYQSDRNEAILLLLEKSLDTAIIVDTNRVRGRYTRKTRHRHDCAADYDDKFGTGGEPNLANLHVMSRRRAEQIRVR